MKDSAYRDRVVERREGLNKELLDAENPKHQIGSEI